MSRISHDLDLRLGLSPAWKGATPASNSTRAAPEFITIEDDDDEDEVQIFHPLPSLETRNFFPIAGPWMHVITEADLGLRLGIGALDQYSGNPGIARNISKDRSRDPHSCKDGKASPIPLSSEFTEVKLKCVICMETMKEETSTVCGHVFCKTCITNAIQVQKKCPTCREKLTLASIHRIYLPGATS